MIVVLGSDGLLGSHIVRRFPEQTIGFTHRTLDITNSEKLGEALYQVMPDVVINCAGVTPHDPRFNANAQAVNTEAPHDLAKLGDQLGFKLIHISTNCVYDNVLGGYTEEDAPMLDTGTYASTKALGEIRTSPVHLTIRTSFVGWPDPKGRGLLAWLFENQNHPVPGYRGVRWNGVTTTVLADCLFELAYNQVSGIRHIFGETVTKYEVLKLASKYFGWECDVVPIDLPKENATLSTTHNDANCHLPTVNFEEQMDMLYRAGNDYA